MERIKEAIKLAKMSRGIADPVSEAPVIQRRHALNGHPTPSAEPAPPRHVQTLHTGRQHLEDNRIIAHLTESALSAPYEILRTKIAQEMDLQNWKVLVVTSPTQACGKTLTAINLALSMSKLPGRSVILVDLDLRRPSVANHLGLQLQHSLVDYVKGDATVDDVIVHIDIAGPPLSIIANASPVRNPSEIMTSKQIASLFSQLRTLPGQPIIIVDVPPLLVSDDVMAFLPVADCCILTVVENVSTNRDIESCEELLASTNFMGCVLNKSSENSGNHYY